MDQRPTSRILSLSGDPAFHEQVAAILRSGPARQPQSAAQCEVRSARDISEAVAAVEKSAAEGWLFDAVLLDDEPSWNAGDNRAAERLRRPDRELPIVFCIRRSGDHTGRGEPGLSLPGSGPVLRQPLAEMEVRQLIAFLVERRGAERALREEIAKHAEVRSRMQRAAELDDSRLEGLLRLGLLSEASLQEITDFALEEAVRLTHSRIGYLAFLNEDETVLTMHSWSKTAMGQCAVVDKPIVYPVESTGIWGEAVRQRKSVVTNDYAAPNPRKKGYPEGHVPIVRHMNVPVFEGERIVAVAGVGNKAEDYVDADVRQLTLVMQGMWRLIQRRETNAELKQHREHLEELVLQRTAQLAAANEELHSRSEELAKRVNELHCLHAISALLQQADLSTAEIMRQTLAAIPAAWQRPEATSARIVLGGEVYQTGNFAETLWKQSAPIIVRDQFIGAIEVCCLENPAADRASPFLDEEQALLEHISDHLGRVIERNTAMAEVESLKQQIEFILGATKTGLDIIDADFNIVYVDPACQAIYGDPAGRQCHEYFHREGMLGADGALARALQTRQPVVTETVLPLEGNRPVQTTTIPFQDARGNWLVAEVNVDLSERKRMERELAQSQRLEAIGHLAAGIAHEINTPIQYVGDNLRFLQQSFRELTDVLACYHRLLEDAKQGSALAGRAAEAAAGQCDLDYLAEEIPKAIVQSVEGVDRVASIVRAMKEFSHPGSREKQRIDLNRAIENTLTVSRNEWKYVADLVTDFDPLLPRVDCLPNEINQAVLVLVVNAAHAIRGAAGDAAGRKGTVTVRTRHSGDWAEVDIEDTGTGIPEAIRHKIFDPFFTTKAIGQGTGQGLAIAQDIVVSKHGGSITFASEVGRGTTFTIRLPVDAGAAGGDLPAAAAVAAAC